MDKSAIILIPFYLMGGLVLLAFAHEYTAKINVQLLKIICRLALFAFWPIVFIIALLCGVLWVFKELVFTDDPL